MRFRRAESVSIPHRNVLEGEVTTSLIRLYRRIGICILIRYNHIPMAKSISSIEFRALAEFRYQIRHFLNASEQAARAAGLEPQQYLFLLALRGLPAGREATIRELAERMQLRHHSAVEMVNRLEHAQLLRRERSNADRRQVILHLTPRGEKILSRLAGQRIAELRTAAPALVRALTAAMRPTRAKNSNRSGATKRRSLHPKQNRTD